MTKLQKECERRGLLNYTKPEKRKDYEKSILYKAIEQFNKQNKLNLQLTQTEEGVIIENNDYRFLSFLQRNRSLHNGMDGAGLVRNAK